MTLISQSPVSVSVVGGSTGARGGRRPPMEAIDLPSLASAAPARARARVCVCLCLCLCRCLCLC